MPTTGLRGSGTSIVNPLQFEKERASKEQGAEQLLQARTDRSDRKKEEEQRLKEADRVLTEDFDKAKTEAVLLGLGKGRASSMSLGSLKGWVEAQRKIKTNQIDIMNLRVAEEKLRDAKESKRKGRMEKMDQARVTQAVQNPKFDMTNPVQGVSGTRNASPSVLKSLLTIGQQNQEFNKAKKDAQPPIPIDKWATRDFDNDGVQDFTQNPNSGAGHPLPRPPSSSGGGGGGYAQYDPTRPILNKKDLSVASPATQFEPTIDQATYDQYDQQRQKLLNELSQPRPPDMDMGETREYNDLIERKRENLNDLSQYLKSARVGPSGGTPSSQPSQPVNQYFDVDGKRTPEYLQSVTNAKDKIRLLEELVQSGKITPQQMTIIAEGGRFPLTVKQKNP
tara:strand:- start:12246 stop:13424 length:1179 start_codon:yes stop_codon:yes gene_type:complete